MEFQVQCKLSFINRIMLITTKNEWMNEQINKVDEALTMEGPILEDLYAEMWSI